MELVNYPFYGHPKVAGDGNRCAFVVDAGVAIGTPEQPTRPAELFIYTQLKVVQVPAASLRQAKPVEYGVKRTRDYIERLLATYLRNGLDFDRKATVRALETLGFPKRLSAMVVNAPRELKVDPRSVKQDHELVTRDEAETMNNELRLMFRALNLQFAEDRKAKRIADELANGQMQFAIKATVSKPKSEKREKVRIPVRQAPAFVQPALF